MDVLTFVFNVTAFAGRGTGLFSGLFLLFVAFGALLVHDLLGLQLALGLEGIDGSLLLWENGVTDFTVNQVFLMPQVRERNITAFAACNGNFGCTPVLSGI
jgi:hypothetical protein